MMETLKKEDINLADWKYQFQQRGEQPILLCDYFSRSVSQHIISLLSSQSETCDTLFTDSSKGYNTRRDEERTIALMQEKIQDHAYLEEFLRNFLEIPRQFNNLADTVDEALVDQSISNEHLADLWKRMDEEFVRIVPWIYYPWYLSESNLLTDRVKEALEPYRAHMAEVCDFDEALLALVFPIKKTAFQLEQEALLGLVEIAARNDDFPHDPLFRQAAEIYLEKYDWLTTFILMPLRPMTYEQLVERVRRAIRESFQETLALQRKSNQKNEERAKQLLKLLAGDTAVLVAIADARELGYVLTAGIEEAYRSSARYLGLMEIVTDRIGVAFEETKYLLSEEIQAALRERQTISAALLQERKQGFIMMTKHGRQMALFGAEGHALSQWVDAELNKVDATVTELRGAIACKGKVKGRVRIACSPEVAHLLEAGEILVTPMTNPDYVPAMRRSAAIVTDEGGLLCHAAIMSREFGKPCIIGTKIATKVLKDGDLVEVDAEKGIVRILEK